MTRTKARIIVFAAMSEHIRMLSEALTSAGHHIAVAADPRKISQLLGNDSWDILIAEIGGPHGVDVEALNAVRADYTDLPIICVSGPGETNRTACGSDILITKPYRISHMEDCITQVLQSTPSPEKGKTDEAILVVDDDDVFRTVLVRSLRLLGYAVQEARNGIDAVDILDRTGVRAVIADINMPGIDGVALMRKIKRRYPHTPVILITGYYASDEWSEKSNLSPDGFLMKPFKIEHIDGLLDDIVGNKANNS